MCVCVCVCVCVCMCVCVCLRERDTVTYVCVCGGTANALSPHTETETNTDNMCLCVQWDCESIVSTYSNIYNHPRQIADSRKTISIIINTSTGMPEMQGSGDGSKGNKDAQRPGLPAGLCSQEEDKEDEGCSRDDDGNSLCPSTRLFEMGARKKDESAEEKKARKEAAKDVLPPPPSPPLSPRPPASSSKCIFFFRE